MTKPRAGEPAQARSFTWIDGERTIAFGPGAAGEARTRLDQANLSGYALLTTDRALGDAPQLADGADLVLRVSAGPVPEAAAAVRDRVGDRPLVALGGGRVIDAAKAIAGADDLRCAAVPTTLSGAEMTRIHRMPAGVERFNLVRPSLVIADPALMASQPLPDLAASAMNALAHAVEALYTPFANPVADMAALRAAELIARGLGGDEPSRAELALAGLLAGYASGSAGYAVHHVVGQTLVRLTGAPHARVYAVLLPHTIRLMAGRAPEAIERVAAALGGRLNVSAPPEETIAERAPRRIAGLDPTPADVAAERIAVLAARSGATRLGELGVKPSAAREVAAEAGARPELQNTPDPPHEEELLEYVEAAL